MFHSLVFSLTLLLALRTCNSQCLNSFTQFPGFSYSSCSVLSGNSAQLSWNYDSRTSLLSAVYVFQPEQTGGWIAWGINHNDTTDMEVSSSLACFPDASGVAVVKQYLLTGTRSSEVFLGGNLNVSSSSCVIDNSQSPGTIYLQFSLYLESGKSTIYHVYGAGPGVDTTSFALEKHDPDGNFGDKLVLVQASPPPDSSITSPPPVPSSNSPPPVFSSTSPPPVFSSTSPPPDFSSSPPPPEFSSTSPPPDSSSISPPPDTSSTPPPPPSPVPGAMNSSSACSTVFSQFPDSSYSACKVLGGNGAKLSWTWNSNSSILKGVFVHQPEATGGWISWGINHNDTTDMEVSSVLTCFADGSGTPTVKQYLLAGTSSSDVSLGGELDVVSSACTIDNSQSPETIYLQFSIKLAGGKSALYHVYGAGPGVDTSTFKLKKHDPAGNFGAFIDVANLTDVSSNADVGNGDDVRLWRIHGALNAIGWGILLPLGAMIARYLKPFADPTWYYLHGTVQLVGYVVGTVGFAYGIKLMSDNYKHRRFAFAVFALGTVQIASVLLKPTQGTRFRPIWTVIHRGSGYSCIGLAIFNIFVGFELLENFGDWRRIYIIAILGLAGSSLILELLIWILWFTGKYYKKVEEPQEEDGSMEKDSTRGEWVGSDRFDRLSQ